MSPHDRNLRSALALQLKSAPQGTSFPEQTVNYYDRFARIDEYLNEHIHPNVNLAAAVYSIHPPQTKPVWLTDHGPDHISTVIQRASELCCIPTHILSSYEVFLLLLGIHFHDVGNIFGREHHERKIAEIMKELGDTLLGANKLEQRMIRDLAMVHGGEAIGDAGNKDTIGQLKYAATKMPRIPLLAAVLRFADELADDHTRTQRFFLNGMIPKEAEIYHLYANRLRQVIIEAKEHRVELIFEINEDIANKQLPKDGRNIYLYDEILCRTMKMHRENIYCSRFMRHLIHLDHIRVTLKICSNDYMGVRDEIIYILRERGYPADVILSEMCPDLTCKTGTELIEYIKTLGPGIEGDE